MNATHKYDHMKDDLNQAFSWQTLLSHYVTFSVKFSQKYTVPVIQRYRIGPPDFTLLQIFVHRCRGTLIANGNCASLSASSSPMTCRRYVTLLPLLICHLNIVPMKIPDTVSFSITTDHFSKLFANPYSQSGTPVPPERFAASFPVSVRLITSRFDLGKFAVRNLTFRLSAILTMFNFKCDIAISLLASDMNCSINMGCDA